MHDSDPEGKRLPIKLDSTSNGEFAPVPLWPANIEANRLAHEAAATQREAAGMLEASVPDLGLRRSQHAARLQRGQRRGRKDRRLLRAAPRRRAGPCSSRARRSAPPRQEFILDVQGHFIDTPKGNSKSAEVFLKDVFMDSDTDVMVLSFVPSARDAEPVTIQAADEVRRLVDKLEGTHRLLLHGRVNPNQPGDLEGMDELHEKWGVSAWKTYTQYGPNGKGYFLHDDVGIRFIEKARALGVKNICIHKGLPFGPRSYEHSQCSDIGVVAKRYPDVNFLIYHSGFVSTVTEKAYDASGKSDGIDTLITSLAQTSGQAEQQRLCGAGQHLALPDARPRAGGSRAGQADRRVRREQRAVGHRFDLVRLAAGPDPGLPDVPDLARELRERHGYPEITPALRAKIFGLNAANVYGLTPTEVKRYTARDSVARKRMAYLEKPDPHFRTYGPKTRREFLRVFDPAG